MIKNKLILIVLIWFALVGFVMAGPIEDGLKKDGYVQNKEGAFVKESETGQVVETVVVTKDLFSFRLEIKPYKSFVVLKFPIIDEKLFASKISENLKKMRFVAVIEIMQECPGCDNEDKAEPDEPKVKT